ncbi:hypothetical protein TanjilG_18685 [Lupinus angustifolius]|uniref:Uncharacterized protein n=1 Tax=Lupinus angustifolius TaxID=3871 RepID=A0A1J7FZA4_LUPAN|nr:hypothetical protein TanjilG_18685 [Lupinus angustifolius]
MEVDKRNKKRVTVREGERDRLKKLKGEENGAAAGGCGSDDTVVVPTDEEVEEFYAILRRMGVAVKYFDGKRRGGKELREVLEQAEVTVVDDHRDACCFSVNKKKSDEEVIANQVLDLNAVAPEAADVGDI